MTGIRAAWTPQGSDPTKVDTDGDGLSDGLEVGLTLPMLADRQTTMSKTFNWWGSEGWGTNKIINATTPTLAGGIHKATGLRLTDADPSSVTDPANHDTDGDGYWDGPTVWEDLGSLGLLLRKGEDNNGDGKYDPAGDDEVMGSLDDETDPDNPTSWQNVNPILCHDENRNRVPDEFESLASDLGQAANYWFGDDATSVTASIIEEAKAEYGDPSNENNARAAEALAYASMLSISSSVASAAGRAGNSITSTIGKAADDIVGVVEDTGRFAIVTVEDGINIAKVGGRVGYKSVYRAALDANQMLVDAKNAISPKAIALQRAFMAYTLAPFLDQLNPYYPAGKQMPIKNDPDYRNDLLINNPDISKPIYAATFVNGMNEQPSDSDTSAQCLNRSYGIPVTWVYNPTLNNGTLPGGFALDVEQCVLQTGFNLLLFMNPQQFDKPCRDLCNAWHDLLIYDKKATTPEELSEKDKHQRTHVVHFAYSQGNIITAPALWRYLLCHSAAFKRIHLVTFGSGAAYLINSMVMPPDTHQVYTNLDMVYFTVGGRDWVPMKLHEQRIQSKISDYPGKSVWSDVENAAEFNPHAFHGDGMTANTYGWWSLYVGGPIFQLNNAQETYNLKLLHYFGKDHATIQSIHGDKWWLSKKNPVKWIDEDDIIQTETDQNALSWPNASSSDKEWVFSSRLWKKTDFIRYNPQAELRNQQHH